MPPPRVLLIGGHGKVSLLMTPLMLSRSWHVTSLIRNAAHKADIEPLAAGKPGKLDLLVANLEDSKTEGDAQAVIDKVAPDWVVWSAGAGGKGGPAATDAIDRVLAQAYIAAAAHTPSVRKFLMVSYVGSRRARAPWWNDADWAATLKVNDEVLPAYAAAKVEADEALLALARLRREKGGDLLPFEDICLRPGTLSDEPAAGKVSLGKTKARGRVSRADVADVAVRLLETDGARGYFDLLDGEEEIGMAVERVVRDGVDAVEGEDVKGIVEKYRGSDLELSK